MPDTLLLQTLSSWTRRVGCPGLLVLAVAVGACTPAGGPALQASRDAALPQDLGAPADAQEAPDLRDDLGDVRAAFTYDRGAIVRGRNDQKVMALVYTGGDYADGGPVILSELQRRGLKASFFFTGDFLRRAEFKPLIERIRDEGHYLGAHSDKHLLYASEDSPPKLLVTRQEFDEDLTHNLVELERFGIPRARSLLFLPPYEQYTPEIAAWTTARGMLLINYTDGTRSNADYLEDDAPDFISADEIVKGILAKEEEPDGLRGFLLLMHLGVGPERTDRLHDRLGGLLDELTRRGYRFVRVDELLPPSVWPAAP